MNIPKILRPINKIILHCTATFESQKVTMEDIRRWHCQENGWLAIGYHYVIDRDGTIMEGRPLGQQGAHCKGHNATSIGICYIGGLEDDTARAMDTRTPAQKASMVKLVKELMQHFGLRAEHIHCHNEYSGKQCPCFSISSFRRELNSL